MRWTHLLCSGVLFFLLGLLNLLAIKHVGMAYADFALAAFLSVVAVFVGRRNSKT
jgi:hypothetical protein